MAIFLDARVPVRFGPLTAAGPDSALLIEGDTPPPAGWPGACFTAPIAAAAHAAGCACCTPRALVAQALSRLFLARARGETHFFREVLVVAATPLGQAAVRTALAEDPLVSAWFRAGSP